MTDVHVPDFCTISEVCNELGFTYYAVSYWLNNGLVKYVPVGSKKLVNMQDLNRFLNGASRQANAGELVGSGIS